MNEIPQTEGNIWSFLVFVLIVGGFAVYKLRSKIAAWWQARQEKK